MDALELRWAARFSALEARVAALEAELRVRPVVREVRQILLTPPQAAAAIGRKPGTLHGWRVASRELLKAGRDPIGPPWVIVRNAIHYKLADVEAWVAKVGVVNGEGRWRADIRRDDGGTR